MSCFNDHSFLQTAMQFYDNSQCINIKEFEDDLKRFYYLKKLFNRYLQFGELKDKLIINHLIVLYNLFGIATPEMLFYKTDKEHWDLLGTFLIFLNRMPEEIPEFNISAKNILINKDVLQILETCI